MSNIDEQQEAIFAEEQAHLEQTYNTICQIEQDVLATMQKNALQAEEDKKNMADELASNFASDGEKQETYIEYANMNTVIDSYNRAQSAAADKLTAVRILKPQPYFAKVVLQYRAGAEPKELYIGNAGLSDNNYKRLVVDWRSPVAEVYYNQADGPTSYVANGRTINIDLKLRRQFDIAGNKLNGCFDTTVAIEDKLLLASLSRQRTSQMQAITTTIQKEQNVVIRHEDVPALLVNGIAGSGKTSVLLQRIAYLFYQQRESLDPRQVFLITPNPVFRTYIDHVLPDMGERNPNILTWAEFAQRQVPPGREFERTDTSFEELQRIDEAVKHLEFQDKDFRDVKSQGTVLISAQQIARVAAKFKNAPAGPHRITLIREELETRLQSRLGQMAGSQAAQDVVSELDYNTQLSVFGEAVNMDTEEDAKKYTLQFLTQQYESAFEAVQCDFWLRVDRIGRRIAGIEELTFLEWLYLKIALTGMGNPDAKYVMIDEVQDYSAAQLAVLARYFRRANFLLLGDENQAIMPSTATFAEIKSVFEQLRGQVSECHLMTSYRSTPAITDLFAKLAVTADGMQISSVQREDTLPVVLECESPERYESELHRVVSDLKGFEGTAALVALDENAVERTARLLGKDAPQVIDGRCALPDSGSILLALPLAKGLEFDHVVVVDASEQAFPENDLSRRRLYTAISRATSTVTVLSNGAISPLLK
jgi:DNA helicase II / ATP-dependent DNA helicase PcrA